MEESVKEVARNVWRNRGIRLIRWLVPSSFPGHLGAILFFVISMSPSLLPRTWWWQGVVSAILVVGGYAVGAAAGIVWRLIVDRAEISMTVHPQWRKWGTRISVGVAVLVTFWSLTRSYYANRVTAQLVGMTAMTPRDYILAFAFTAGLVLVVRLLVLGLLHLWNTLNRYGQKILPTRIAPVLATLLIVAILVFVSSDVIFKAGMEFAYRKAAELNTSTPPGISQPVTPMRSGSASSYSSWDDIGIYGKEFLVSGPDAHMIEQVTGRDAMEPIRVYAGLRKDRDLHEAAELVVDELHRTRAFERSVLVLATATGTGWLEEWSIQPVEYLTGGDCAIATMQYSYVPSAIAFIREFDSPMIAGQVLYDTVMEAVRELPADERPAVYLTGVSLGALGSQSPFDSESDVIEGVDGAVWVGNPNSTPLWRTLTDSRHRGSPEVAPVISNGHHIRFVNGADQLRTDLYGREFGEWRYPRITYVQHPTDPVVWWSPQLFATEPAWLRERAGRDVNPAMRWIRGATMVQMMADLPLAGTTPDGHGHMYHRELIPVWQSVLGLDEGSSQTTNPYRGADPQWVNERMIERMITAIERDLYG
ncbi:MAG: alpha/beta-hydrolase family protein [Actinomycetaceae bacterium]|nr:alpha/beta-hydrolase family protein [Actinomycetaceae bacterium]